MDESLGARDVSSRVRCICDALLELAASEPFGEEISRHVRVIDFSDSDDAVENTLCLNDVLLQEGLAFVRRCMLVENRFVRR